MHHKLLDPKLPNNHNVFVSLISKLFPKTDLQNPHPLLLDNGREILLHFKKLKQSKRMRLRIGKDGKSVIVTMPQKQSHKAAHQFAQSANDWILKNIEKSPEAISFNLGGDIPVLGKKTILKIAPPRSKMIFIKDEGAQVLIIPSKPENFPEKTKSTLKKLALEAAQTHLKILEPKLLKGPNKIRITDTKSRWGSCSHDGTISLCWRLILASPDVFHYVIAHELAHLKEMNHSPNFWNEVARLFPNYKIHQKWLKQNGPMLHRIGL